MAHVAAAVRSLSEREAAAWAEEQGRRVTWHRSRAWEQIRPGFYQPVHLLGAVPGDELSRPARACWGYRAVLPPGSETPGRMSVYLLDDLAGYDESALTYKRRGTLRRAQRSSLRIVELADDTRLRREGYDVCLSAYERFGFARLPTYDEYVRRLAAQRIGEWSLALGAVVDDRLVGYVINRVIAGVAQGDDFHLHADALRANAATPLLFELLQVLRASGVVRQVWNGMVDDGDPGLDAFKTSMGFARVGLPVHVHLPLGARPLFRRWRPGRYERLTGEVVAA